MNNVSALFKGSQKLATLVNVDEVVSNLARLLQKTVKSSWIVIYLFDRERSTFAPPLEYKLPVRYQSLFRQAKFDPDKIPLIRKRLRKHRHLFAGDPATLDLLPDSLKKIPQRLDLLLVPMVLHNDVIGMIFIARSRLFHPFAKDDLEIIHDMVFHGALIVSHMRLFDESLDMAVEMAKGIDIILTLDEINKAISSSLSRDKIIETAMQSIERIIRCEMAALFVEEKGRLVVTSSHAYGPPIPPQLVAGAEPSGGRCAVWDAFTLGRSRYIPDLDRLQNPGGLDRGLARSGIRSLLAIPLISRDKVTGVLLLADTKSGQFGKEAAFTIEKIAAQMAVALDNASLYENMRSLFINTISSLANVIDAKSPWTKGHSERVMHIASNIAKEMGLDEDAVERIRLGGLLHDIGKIGVIEALLEKPEILTEDEFPPLRLHPEKGVAILAPIEQLEGVLPAILYHHERYDGTGYPKGLKGEDIPLEARIVTVADSFDAMVEDRPYRKGFSVDEAINELQGNAGSQFDPKVVDHFIRYLKRKRGEQAHVAPTPA